MDTWTRFFFWIETLGLIPPPPPLWWKHASLVSFGFGFDSSLLVKNIVNIEFFSFLDVTKKLLFWLSILSWESRLEMSGCYGVPWEKMETSRIWKGEGLTRRGGRNAKRCIRRESLLYLLHHISLTPWRTRDVFIKIHQDWLGHSSYD